MAHGERLFQLIKAVKENNAKTAIETVSNWTVQEQEAIAYLLEETAQFLRRNAKDWKEVMNYPAENEE